MKLVILFLLLQTGVAWASALAPCNQAVSALAERESFHEFMMGKQGFLLSDAFRKFIANMNGGPRPGFDLGPVTSAEVSTRMTEVFNERFIAEGDIRAIGGTRTTLGITYDEYVSLARAMTKVEQDSEKAKDLRTMLDFVLPGMHMLVDSEASTANIKRYVGSALSHPLYRGVLTATVGLSAVAAQTHSFVAATIAGVGGAFYVGLPAAYAAIDSLVTWHTRRSGKRLLRLNLAKYAELRANIAATAHTLAKPEGLADPSHPLMLGWSQSQATVGFANKVGDLVARLESTDAHRKLVATIADKHANAKELLAALSPRVHELQAARIELEMARREARNLETAFDNELARANELRAQQLENHGTTSGTAREELEVQVDHLTERLAAMDGMRDSVAKFRQTVERVDENSRDSATVLQSTMLFLMDNRTEAEVRARAALLAKTFR